MTSAPPPLAKDDPRVVAILELAASYDVEIEKLIATKRGLELAALLLIGEGPAKEDEPS